MVIQLCQPVIACQFQIVKPLQSHAVLNLEKIQVHITEMEHEIKFILKIWMAE